RGLEQPGDAPGKLGGDGTQPIGLSQGRGDQNLPHAAGTGFRHALLRRQWKAPRLVRHHRHRARARGAGLHCRAAPAGSKTGLARIAGFPPGFSVSTPLVIQAGQSEAKGTINAPPAAPKPDELDAATTKVTARATIDGKPEVKEVNNFGKVALGEKPKLFVFFEPDPRAQPVVAASHDVNKPFGITI